MLKYLKIQPARLNFFVPCRYFLVEFVSLLGLSGYLFQRSNKYG